MDKTWKKTSKNLYSLVSDRTEVISLDLTNKKNVIGQYEGKKIIIKRKCKASRLLEVFDEQNTLIAQTTRRKWYSSDVILKYKEKVYLIKSRNNPLFEMVLQSLEKQDILAYGIELENLEQTVKTTDNRQNLSSEDYLLDIILWICFVSIPHADTLEDLLF